MLVYRLSALKFGGDLSGNGAKKLGGRWNSKGFPMVYCCGTISLCTLELAAHSGGLSQLKTLAITCIEIDNSLSLKPISIQHLPHGWQEVPATFGSKEYGNKWIVSNKSPVIAVPSAIVPREYIFLLNPIHPEFDKLVKVKWVEPFNLDPRII
jgi:RES domain-containing protein